MRRVLSLVLVLVMLLGLLSLNAFASDGESGPLTVIVNLPQSAVNPTIQFAFSDSYTENGFDTAQLLNAAAVENDNGTISYSMVVPNAGIVYYVSEFEYIQGVSASSTPRVQGVAGQFPVTRDDQRISLVTWFFAPQGYSLPDGIALEDIRAEVSDSDGYFYSGACASFTYTFSDGSISEPIGLLYLLPAYENESLYNFFATIQGHEDEWFPAPKTNFVVSASGSTNFEIIPPLTRQFRIPKGATIELGFKQRHYIPLAAIEPASVDKTSDPNYDIYTFSYGNIAGVSYRVKKEGYVTQARIRHLSQMDPVSTVDLEPVPAERVEYTNPTYEDTILMNAPDSQYVCLAENETFTIRPLRSNQIINSAGENYYIEPEFHYEVVSGNSVEITEICNSYNYNSAVVKAVRPGVSLVRVTYDPIEVDGNYLNGIAPEQAGLLVFSVGGTVGAFDTGIGLREYDTVYINGGIYHPDGTVTPAEDSVSYTFTPAAGTAVRVLPPPADPLGCGDWGFASGPWQTCTAAADGSFTVQLYEGRNIVELTNGSNTEYHVIRAKSLKINIENLTEPGKPAAAGDKIKISFDGLTTPLPKMAAIYNPGYASSGDPTVGVRYRMNGELVRSGGTQYALMKQNAITVTLEDSGTYRFRDGNIGCSWFGSGLDSHRNISKAGLTPNFNAPDNELRPFSILPEFDLEVAEQEDPEELAKEHFCDLEGLYFNNEYSGIGLDNIQQNMIRSLTSLSQNLEITGIKYKGIVYGNVQYTHYISPGVLEEFERRDGIPEDLTITWRYWRQNRDGTSEVFVENVTSFPISADSFSIDYDDPFDSYGSAILGELIIQPKDPDDGYAKTYSASLIRDYGNFFATVLKEIVISPVGSTSTYSRHDGEFIANPVMIDETETALGYGFLIPETEYSYSVPYATEAIRIKPVTFSRDLDTSQQMEVATVEIYRDDVLIETLQNPQQDATLLDYSLPISLNTGTTSIKLVVSTFFNMASISICDPRTYTINVTRGAAPNVVTFSLPQGAEVLVEQNGKTVFPDADGAYILTNGSYTYHVSQAGYLTESQEFTVSGSMEISVDSLVPVPAQSGSVSVRIAGQSAVLTPERTVEISEEPDDLTEEGYVRYNHGGYTVLHALIDACAARFECEKGVFIPYAAIDETGLGQNAGWVCRVNGEICADPANTLAKDGDKIDLYFDSDYADMLYARFAGEDVRVTEGSGAELTLTVGGDESVPIAGAEIYIGETLVGVTDSAGKITVPAALLTEKRSYFLRAEKKNAAGQNILTCAVAVVTVEKDENKDPANPGKTTVTFRLVGDALHDENAAGHQYVTWIGTTSFVFSEEKVSVGEVFTRALEMAGLSSVGLNQNYISAIVGPDGVELSEFDNGNNSGWMYTVNGKHPGFGLNNVYVTDGDEIVWHYIDDYIFEVMDNFGGSSGNTSVWNTWFDAPDAPSINAGAYVTIEKAQIKQTGTTFTATLPAGSKYPAAAQISVTPEDKAAVVSALTGPTAGEDGETWTFSVTSESGTTVNYTLIVEVEPGGLSIASVTVDKTEAQVGDTITWTSEAADGDGTYRYCFYVFKDGAIEERGKYGAANRYTYTPETAGVYTVRAYVKDGTGKIASLDNAGSVTVTEKTVPALAVVSVTSSVTQAQVGDSITWTSEAAGGDGTYRYCFYVFKNGAIEERGKYGASNRYTYTPETAGVYTVRAYVKDGTGKITSLDQAGSVTVAEKVIPVLTVVSVTPDKTQAQAGDSITWTAEAANAAGAVRYCFYVFKNGAIEERGSYGPANYYTFTAGEPGTYTVRVYVKDASGTVSTLDKAGAVAAAAQTPLAVTGVTPSAAQVRVGDAITWTAAASGGSGSYRYCFYVFKNGAIEERGSYGTANSYTFTPTAAGTYTVRVYVKDASGTVSTLDKAGSVSVTG